jgi:hypothetical protein
MIIPKMYSVGNLSMIECSGLSISVNVMNNWATSHSGAETPEHKYHQKNILNRPPLRGENS